VPSLKEKQSRDAAATARHERFEKIAIAQKERMAKAVEMHKMQQFRLQNPDAPASTNKIDLVEKVTADIEKEVKEQQEQETKRLANEASVDQKVQQMEAEFAKDVEEENASLQEEKKQLEEFEKIDVFGVEDINNVSNGRPLYSAFATEDWLLLGLRFELYLLLNSFQQDVKEEDRKCMHIDNLAYYYQKYTKKLLSTTQLGFEDVPRLVNSFLKDAVQVDPKTNILKVSIPLMESFDVFVMLTEEARRDRERRVALGDTTVQIKVPSSGLPSATAASSALGLQTAAKGKGKGFKGR